jgi:hypothetical protein
MNAQFSFNAKVQIGRPRSVAEPAAPPSPGISKNAKLFLLVSSIITALAILQYFLMQISSYADWLRRFFFGS